MVRTAALVVFVSGVRPREPEDVRISREQVSTQHKESAMPLDDREPALANA